MQRVWHTAAAGWRLWSPHFQRWLLPVTEIALDMACVRAGCSVIDIAAGDGGQSLQAAGRVGSAGSVLAADISGNMLAYAAESARLAGVDWLEFGVMDGENLALPAASFDVALCRAALMVFPDPLRALREARRVLKPGGCLGVIVFTNPERNPFFSLPARLTPGGAVLPGIFRLGGRGVLEDLISRAGFRSVETRILAAPLRLDSASECLSWQIHLFQLLGRGAAIPTPDWSEVASALNRYVGRGGFELPGEVLIGVGRVSR